MEKEEAGDVDRSAGVAPVTGAASHAGGGGDGSGGRAATTPAPSPPQVAVGRGRGRGRGRTTPGIGKKMKTANLKNYFTKLSASLSGSRPSTNENRNTTGSIAAEIVQNHVPDIAPVEIETTNAHPQTQPQEEHEDIGIDLIVEFDPHVHIVSDPALRLPIERFHPNIQSELRRAYLLRGPTHPVGHIFPRKKVGRDWRVFHPQWFKDYDWIEYSVSKDAAFCLRHQLKEPSQLCTSSRQIYVTRCQMIGSMT
ncbi:hypothetical protein BS78_02G012400 [Paspalum vaginatum]|nr:hypothetical protein BS78_02G012400 [Paspalum vaginatum]KAJ1287472.1 hypothetical protein BS78_02G012400 [Paspalum vaginatum]KAJ1287473.1 hypothetical protein BS78_02G012400 [Paspalum vaginatum]